MPEDKEKEVDQHSFAGAVYIHCSRFEIINFYLLQTKIERSFQYN